jgi:putative transcriptional regulator
MMIVSIIRKGAVRLNPATRHNTHIQELSVPLLIFFGLILPAMVIVNAPPTAATVFRDAYDQKVSHHFQQVAGDIKSEKNLAQGKFLVADRRLMDPNFRETVVLLIRYGPDGAMGLVINRPVKLKLSTVLPDIKELDQRKDTLHLGGPVETARFLLLLKSANPPEASMPVFDDVYISSSPKALQRLVEKPVEEERFHIYAGYAGWAPHQLESEYDRGDWHVLKADAETLFDKRSSEIWQELIQRVSVKWVRTINTGKLLEQNYPRNPVPHKIVKKN